MNILLDVSLHPSLTPLITSIIVLLGTIISSIVFYKINKDKNKFENESKNRELQLKEKELELKEKEFEINRLRIENKKLIIERDQLALFYDSEFQTFMREELDMLFKKTKTKQFLILFAVNGKTDFNYVTAGFADDNNLSSMRSYSRLEVDENFRIMLKHAESKEFGYLNIDRNNMEESLLKHILTNLNMTQTLVKFLHRKKIDDDNDVVIFSFLSQDEETHFNNVELATIQSFMGKLKQKASEIKIE